MFIPEYTITAKTLKSIATVEYSKAIIENTVILPQWEKQLKNQACVDEIVADLQLENYPVSAEVAKKTVDGLLGSPPVAISNLKLVLDNIIEAINSPEVEESELKELHRKITAKIEPEGKSGIYRSNMVMNKVAPEEILAEIVELFDWVNSIDAKDTHPLIVTAIMRARLEQIAPFEQFNTTTLNLMAIKILKAVNYSCKNFVTFSSYMQKGLKEYKNQIIILENDHTDYTAWLEYFCQGYAMQAATGQEKVKLLARDTKVAKVTGRTKLSARQEKIIEYLQDYGILQNKDFVRIFPEKSEDSILRDLKVLIDMGLVQKAGSTKSSRYELK